ncbi:MAG: DUF1109 family protein [Rhodospirillales bacterium]|nr:DUF1109 family protein [Rhodospirillales bacterium]
MRTDDLITAVVHDEIVEPWTMKRSFALAIALGVAVAGTTFFLAIGFRSDIAQASETIRFLFKFVITLGLTATASGLVVRLARPGVPTAAWGWAIACVPLVLVGGVIVELALMPVSSWGPRLVGTNARFCLSLIPLLAIGPLGCFLLALRHGAPTRPRLAGAVAGLAASGIAATFYAANCTDDSPLFVATWYPLATGIVVLIGCGLAGRMLRW